MHVNLQTLETEDDESVVVRQCKSNDRENGLQTVE